jgi:hypothetical protein
MKQAEKKLERRPVRADSGLQLALQRSGKRLFYLKPCLLPCLLLDVVIKERSREEASEADLMLLRCIRLGLRNTASLSRVMGIDVRTQLIQAQGSSLVDGEEGSWRLSEVGAECLQFGVPIRRVRRALRLCAISGRLLPRNAYELPLTLLLEEEMQTKGHTAFIAEPDSVPLSALQDGWQQEKKRLNLADETLEIEQVVSHKPALQHASLALVGDKGVEQAWVLFGRDQECYRPDQVLPMREPFDPNREIRQGSQSDRAGDLLLRGLSKLGLDVQGDLLMNVHGLPHVCVSNASEEWLRKPLVGGARAALCCATRELPGRAITFVPGVDSRALDGYALTIQITDAALCEHLDRYKKADEIWCRLRSERNANFNSTALRTLMAEEFGAEEWPKVQVAIRRFGSKQQIDDWCDVEVETDSACAEEVAEEMEDSRTEPS